MEEKGGWRAPKARGRGTRRTKKEIGKGCVRATETERAKKN